MIPHRTTSRLQYHYPLLVDTPQTASMLYSLIDSLSAPYTTETTTLMIVQWLTHEPVTCTLMADEALGRTDGAHWLQTMRYHHVASHTLFEPRDTPHTLHRVQADNPHQRSLFDCVLIRKFTSQHSDQLGMYAFMDPYDPCYDTMKTQLPKSLILLDDLVYTPQA